MKKIRAMSARLRALPCLIGALALALASSGKASADTCLLSNNWQFLGIPGSVDGAGTVTLADSQAIQGPIPAQHPVLSGTVQNGDAPVVLVGLILFDSGGHQLAAAALDSPGTIPDAPPTAVEGRTWLPGMPTAFTLDANAMVAQLGLLGVSLLATRPAAATPPTPIDHCPVTVDSPGD
jgi:hypothetical protein